MEPVSVQDLLNQLEMTMPTDSGLAAALAASLTEKIRSAREDCENYMRRCIMLQTHETRLSGFPHDRGHERLREGEFYLPSPPLLAVISFVYLDTTGTQQTLVCDRSGGAAANLPAYFYQINKGTETQPARVSPGYLCMWPPMRHVEDGVAIRFRCGYGGNITASIAQGSAVLETELVFVQDDVGTSITIPEAGAEGGDLKTTILSVDVNGVATLTDEAAAAQSEVDAYYGRPVPESIRQAVLIQAQTYYTQGYGADMIPFVESRLRPYRNDIA
jgi:hypothetical protein